MLLLLPGTHQPPAAVAAGVAAAVLRSVGLVTAAVCVTVMWTMIVTSWCRVMPVGWRCTRAATACLSCLTRTTCGSAG